MNSSDAYAYAWEHADRNPDGSRIEASIVKLLAEHVDFDTDAAKTGHAQRILARRKRPGQTAAEGEVVFPGMEHYAYEPRRVLADDRGNVIENADALIQFKTAEARRAQEDAQTATARAAREQNEAGHFAVWVAEQLAAGRDKREVTWDTCVRETGLWKDAGSLGPAVTDDWSTEDEVVDTLPRADGVVPPGTPPPSKPPTGPTYPPTGPTPTGPPSGPPLPPR